MSYEKVKRLYEFVAQVYQQRYPVVKNIKEHGFWLYDLEELPIDPNVKFNPDEDSFLKIYRPELTSCPKPKDILNDWLLSGWNDPYNEPQIIDQQHHEINEKTIIENFIDNQLRVDSFESWKNSRKLWAEKEKIVLKTKKLYDELYEIQNTMEREAGTYELMIGDGFFHYSNISHPVLLRQIEIEFYTNETKPYFSLSFTDQMPKIYAEVFSEIDDIDFEKISKFSNQLEDSMISPLGGEETTLFLKSFISFIFRDGEFLNEPVNLFTEKPSIKRSKILFLRKISGGIIGKCNEIIASLDAENLPPVVTKIVGSKEIVHPVNETIENLFVKPANDEQHEIASKLDNNYTVIVQGPPGTGKTHTIANLIGHLLAQGKSVLVTSHTTKALSVLREKLPESLQSLCVSLAVNDKQRKSELESSIMAISEKIGTDYKKLEKEVEHLENTRKKLKNDIYNLKLKLREILSFEYQDIEFDNEKISPSEASRYLERFQEYTFIASPIKKESAFPLTDEELSILYGLHDKFSISEELDSTYPLLSISDLYTKELFHEKVEQFNNLKKLATTFAKNNYWNFGDCESTKLTKVYQKLQELFDKRVKASLWRTHATVSGMGTNSNAGWIKLLSLIREVNETYNNYSQYAYLSPKLSENFSFEAQYQYLSELTSHYEAGGKISFLHRATKPKWWKLYSDISISGAQPSSSVHFKILSTRAHLELLRSHIQEQYKFLIESYGGESFETFGQSPEHSLSVLANEIEYCLKWHELEWLPAIQHMEACGFDWNSALEKVDFKTTPTESFDRLNRFVSEIVIPAFETQIVDRKIIEIEIEIEKFAKTIEESLKKSKSDNWQYRFIQAIREKNNQLYSENYNYLLKLESIQEDTQLKNRLIQKIELVSPNWARELKNRTLPHNTSKIPEGLKIAWKWRRLNDEIERRNSHNPLELQNNIDRLDNELKQITQQLIEEKAWSKQIKLLQENSSIHTAFNLWVELQKKLPKGRTKANGTRFDKLSKEIRAQSSKCQ